MSIKKRLERLEGAIEPGRDVHVVNITTWSTAELKGYEEGSEGERWGILRARIPGLGEGDTVVLTAVPRPVDES